MAAATLFVSKPPTFRRRPRSKIDPCLAFIDLVESSWKGNEAFAIWLVKKLRPQTVVDLGFDRGLSTLAFAYNNPGHVYALDWIEEGQYASKSYALDYAFRNITDAIAFEYIKNVHLIIGPFSDIAKKWTRRIDILHMDGLYTYEAIRQQFQYWKPFLSSRSVVLVHNIQSHPEGPGRFFEEFKGPKKRLSCPYGLGVVTENERILQGLLSWGEASKT